MPQFITKLNDINKLTTKNNNVITIIFTLTLLILTYLLYTFIFQSFMFFISTFIGCIASFYFIALKLKTADKTKNKIALLKLLYTVALYIQCNEKFLLHKNTEVTTLLPWEKIIHFYDFQSLPMIHLECLDFLQEKEPSNLLFEAILAFNYQIITLTKALNDLQHYQGIYLEKINIWEAKIKSMKGIRQMQSTDLHILKEKIGTNLTNQLIFLTDLINNISNSIQNDSTRLIALIEHYKKERT